MVDEVPLFAVPYVEKASAETVDTSSLDAFIASIRATVAEIPAEAPAAVEEIPAVAVGVEVSVEEAEPAAEAEQPDADTTSLDDLIAKVRLSVSDIAFVDETPIADPAPVGENFESLEHFISDIRASVAAIPVEAPVAAAAEPVIEEVPVVEEPPAADTTSLDAFIASIRATVGEIPAEPVPVEAEPAAAQPADSLDALIAQVRATVADVTAEPVTESLDDVIDYVKDAMSDGEV